MEKSLQQRLLDSLKELDRQFSEGAQPGETDAQIADALVGYILDRGRLLRGVVGGTPEGNAVDEETLAKMAEWDSDDPALLHVEKALRRFATGRGSDAVTLLKRTITDRQQATSDEQRRRASTPRNLDPLQELIEKLVRDKPKISAKELEKCLHREIGRGVITHIVDNEIELEGGRRASVKISGLKDRLTRAKQKIAKAG